MTLTRTLKAGLIVAAALALASPASAQWNQWAGPNRDFSCEANLSSNWPEEGPKKLWTADIGDGFSGVLCDGKTVYTQYREADDQHEVVIALDAATGKERWRYQIEAPLPEGATTNFGKGPNATPLIVGNRLFTIGFTAKLSCLDTATGKALWTKDLWKEFEGTFLNFGYAASPLAHGENVIILLGGENNAILSLKAKDGAVNWKSHSYLNSYSSPILIDVDGEEQMVAFMGTQIVGILPTDGTQVWSHPHENQWKTNICTPLWGKDHLLYFGSGSLGSEVLKLTRKDGKTEVEKVWESRRFQLGHTNVVRIGDTLYGTSGDGSVNFLVAVSVEDGSITWRERGYTKVNFVRAGDKLLMLDEDGVLMLGAPGEDGMEILARAKILEKVAWTIPTVVGNRVFVRDRKQLRKVP
jgi:outer membrane protein assembly factor BamB